MRRFLLAGNTRRFAVGGPSLVISSARPLSASSFEPSDAAPTPPSSANGGSDSHHDKTRKIVFQDSPAAAASELYSPAMEADTALKEKVVQYLLSRDKELFNLKRQHELALLRIEQAQDRRLKDEKTMDVFQEHGANVNTFEEVSISHYTRRGSFFHIAGAANIRIFKTALWLGSTAMIWIYLYFKYIVDPDKEYVAQNMSLLGSNYHVMKKLAEDRELAAEIRV
jgi:hypothetical protein